MPGQQQDARPGALSCLAVHRMGAGCAACACMSMLPACSCRGRRACSAANCWALWRLLLPCFSGAAEAWPGSRPPPQVRRPCGGRQVGLLNLVKITTPKSLPACLLGKKAGQDGTCWTAQSARKLAAAGPRAASARAPTTAAAACSLRREGDAPCPWEPYFEPSSGRRIARIERRRGKWSAVQRHEVPHAVPGSLTLVLEQERLRIADESWSLTGPAGPQGGRRKPLKGSLWELVYVAVSYMMDPMRSLLGFLCCPLAAASCVALVTGSSRTLVASPLDNQQLLPRSPHATRREQQTAAAALACSGTAACLAAGVASN